MIDSWLSGIKKLLLKSELVALLLLKFRSDSYLHRQGWFTSFRKKMAIDRDGAPVPWMTYPSVSFLGGRIRQDMTVFEYGCGNSTIWWASRVRSVVACEHDREWFAHVKSLMPANVTLTQRDLGEGGYSRRIAEYRDEFDIIVIDGRERVECIKNALPALKQGGVVIWDNSDLESYSDGYDYLLENGFRQIDFYGMGPIGWNGWGTSVYYKNNNCLGI